MGLFDSAIVSGIALGSTFSLIALGLVLAFRATRTFNFAHGELMLLPAFIVGYAQAHRLPIAADIVIALAVTGGVGALFYLLVLRRTTGLPLFMGIIATFGLASILDGAMGIMFGSNQYDITLAVLPKGSFHFGGATFGRATIALAAFGITLALAVVAVLRFTHLGIKVRAAGQDPILAAQCGIRVRRLYLGSWAAAAVLAAVAGIIYGSEAVVNTSMIDLGFAAIPAIVLGGMDSIEGAIIGGLAIGLVQSFTQIYIGGTYTNLITYAALLAALLVCPQGLLGTREVIRA